MRVIGDLDANGVADIIVSEDEYTRIADNVNGASIKNGRVLVLYLDKTGDIINHIEIRNPIIAPSTETSTHFGYQGIAGGDLNSNGTFTISVASAGANERYGRIWMFEFNANKPFKDQGVLDKLLDIGWISEASCNDTAVTCDFFNGELRVTKIISPNKGLTGAVPTELGLLDGLSHIDMSNNDINHPTTIPLSVCNLLVLTTCDFSENTFSCPVSPLTCDVKCNIKCQLRDQPVLDDLLSRGKYVYVKVLSFLCHS